MAKTSLLQCRVTVDQRKQIAAFASASRMELSKYVREVALMGYTFQMQVNAPQEIQVESMTIERNGSEARGKSNRHATG